MAREIRISPVLCRANVLCNEKWQSSVPFGSSVFLSSGDVGRFERKYE